MSHRINNTRGAATGRMAGLVLAVAVVAGGTAVATAGPAAAGNPLVAACAFTDSNQISVQAQAGGLLGQDGLATVTLRDAGTNALLGTSISANILNGTLVLPPTAITLPVGSQVGTAGIDLDIVPTVGGIANEILGHTACDALPTQALTGAYEALAPARVLDTRSGAAVPAGGSITLQLLGAGGVPNDALSPVNAVNLVLTATGAKAAGFITAYPSGGTRPATSNLNYVAGQDVANSVLAVPGTNGKVVLYNGSNGTVNLIADVAGYYTGGVLPLLPGAFKPLTPTRILDTRSGSVGKSQPLKSFSIPVAGLGGLPGAGEIGSVVLNLTVTNPTASGHLRTYPSGTSVPFASNINFDRGRTVANLVVVGVGSDGKVSFFNGSPGGTTDVIVDVVGYIQSGLLPAQLPGLQNVVAPFRLLDTRYGIGRSGTTPVPAHTSVTFQVDGRDGIPTSFVRAVVLTVTATREMVPGFATVYPEAASRPNTSVLNFKAGSDIADLVIEPVGANGTVTIYNGSPSTTHLVVDVSAYITGATLSAV